MVHCSMYYVFGYHPSSCLLSKNHPVYFSKHDVSETGFCPRPQVKPTQLGQIELEPISGQEILPLEESH
jgi:hypothetical protein